MESYQNQKERDKRKFQQKEERTDVQRGIADLVKITSNWVVPLLIANGMILLGVFLRIIFG